MPFLITFLAGLATLIGYLFIYLDNSNNKVLIGSLGFASGVMFYISLFDLIPESIKMIGNSYNFVFSIMLSFLFIVSGIIISSFLNKLSLGDSYLYHVGIISMIALIVHNIPEGIATYLTSSVNLTFGLTLAISIALHNIPEGISISIPIYYSTGSKIKAFLYTLISGMSEFLGAILASFFISNPSFIFMGALYSIIAGIMLYISICELLPASIGYKRYSITILSFILGIIFIHISILLIN